MSVLEDRSTQRSRGKSGDTTRLGAAIPPPKDRRGGRFVLYFTRYGWIHALLLLGVWLFVFPYLWMLATSVKTDEELAASANKIDIVPQFVPFRADSPYVRKVPDPLRPQDVPEDRWTSLLPRLSQICMAAIEKYQASHPPVKSVGGFDAAGYLRAAATQLVNDTVAKINRHLWTGRDGPLLTAFGSQITDDAIVDGLDAALGGLRLTTFQLKTLDLHTYDLTNGPDFTSQWKVESGDAKLFQGSDATMLSYHFDSPNSDPIVLRCDFHLPPGVRAGDIHRLTLATGADNSWHRATASLDIAGDHWVAGDVSYIAQFRPQSFIFQPPTYDDQTLRAKDWVSLKKEGPAPTPATISGQGVPATFRLIILPSSTFRANWGKFWRNYELAFRAVPFVHYIANSLLLVVLSTSGALFSASFVAYAFARLHWPGRSVAFILLLSTMMLPGQVTMIPGFLVWRAIHWYNTLNPLWVPAFFGSAFFIFLMTQQMRTIPKDLEEAARIDGLNAVQSWYYVILPQVTPTLAAIAILQFMGAWNDFMGPLIYLRDQTRFPLSLGLYGLGLMRQGGGFSWSVVMAGDIMMTLPVIAVFFLFQRYFVQGMTLTGMKG